MNLIITHTLVNTVDIMPGVAVMVIGILIIAGILTSYFCRKKTLSKCLHAYPLCEHKLYLHILILFVIRQTHLLIQKNRMTLCLEDVKVYITQSMCL